MSVWRDDRLGAFDPVDGDDLVPVEPGEVDQFLGLVAEVLQERPGDLAKVEVVEEGGGEGEGADAETVAVGGGVALDVAAGAQGSEEAEERAAVHADGPAQLGEGEAVALVGGEGLEDGEPFVEGREDEFGLRQRRRCLQGWPLVFDIR